MTQPAQDDRIRPLTRIVAAIIIPFLVLAFIILYLFPHLSGQRFAWEIVPNMTAAYMGAGYLGGAYLFAQALVGRRWHRVSAGFPGVTAFTVAMLLATLLHWSRFDPGHFPFQVWLVLYVITPVLVPLVWLYNRSTDAGSPEPGDVRVPGAVRVLVLAAGTGLILMAIAGLAFPQLLIRLWPWALTPLTARVLAGWGALLGVGAVFIASEARWSAWRVPLESIASWHALVLAAAVMHRQDFTSGLVNWYTLSVAATLLAIGLLYFGLEAWRWLAGGAQPGAGRA
jgi:hypothetical protein